MIKDNLSWNEKLVEWQLFNYEECLPYFVDTSCHLLWQLWGEEMKVNFPNKRQMKNKFLQLLPVVYYILSIRLTIRLPALITRAGNCSLLKDCMLQSMFVCGWEQVTVKMPLPLLKQTEHIQFPIRYSYLSMLWYDDVTEIWARSESVQYRLIKLSHTILLSIQAATHEQLYYCFCSLVWHHGHGKPVKGPREQRLTVYTRV